MDYILHLWLKDVPDYTTGFCQLVLVSSLVSTLSNLMAQVARAYGKIRNYQVVVSLFLVLNFPLSFIVLKFGFSPLSTMCVNIGIQSLLLLVRLAMTGKMIRMTSMDFIKNVLVQVSSVTLASIIFPVILCSLLDNSFLDFICVSIVSFGCVCLATYCLGMNRNERQYIVSMLLKGVNKKR